MTDDAIRHVGPDGKLASGDRITLDELEQLREAMNGTESGSALGNYAIACMNYVNQEINDREKKP